MNTHRRATLVIALVSGLPAAAGAAQARPDSIAFAGGPGVYVWLGGTVVSRAHPVDGVAGHRVERRRDGAGEWMRVADVAAVENARALFGPLDSVTRSLMRRAFAQPTDAAVWEYIVRFPRADSLAALLGHEGLRLALGFYALDRDVRPGDRWQYRVTPLGGDARPGAARLSNVVTFPGRPMIDTVRALRVDDGERHVRIWWDLARGRGIRMLEIWRRRGTGEAFRVVDTVSVAMRVSDSLQALFEDPDVTPGVTYAYFARPYDVFFNAGAASDTATAYAVAGYRLVVPDSLVARGIDSLGVELRWRLPTVGLARAVRVYRSPAQDTGWYRLADLPGDARRFVDERVEPMVIYHYRLVVLGLRGDESPPTGAVFGYVRARVPPLPPGGVTALAADRGVAVCWAPNSERDLRGYYVYRTDAPVDTSAAPAQLELVSSLVAAPETSFVDTLPQIAARQFAYVVRAVNTSNLLSAPSHPAPAPVAAAGAGLADPPAPTGLTAAVSGDRVRIQWDDPGMTAPAVREFRMWRRTGTDTVLRPLAAAPLAVNAAWDTTVAAGTVYEYVVRLVDVRGTSGPPSAPARVRVPRAAPVAPPDPRATAESEGIRVTWGEVVGFAARVRVYRAEGGQAAERVAEVGAESGEYLDRGARPGVRYYYVLTLFVDGVEGARSIEVTARR